MLGGKLVLLHVLRRRIADLFVPLNLDDENAVALLDEEVRAEFPALWVFAFLPGILDGVEANWRILQPGVYNLCVVPLAERTHEPALGHGIRNDQVGRCLEVTAITNLLPPSPKIPIRVFNFPEELSLLFFQSGFATWRVEHRLGATAQFGCATAFPLSFTRVQGDKHLGQEFVNHSLGRFAPQRAQYLQKPLPVLARNFPGRDVPRAAGAHRFGF
jgi:hypothetical protein